MLICFWRNLLRPVLRAFASQTLIGGMQIDVSIDQIIFLETDIIQKEDNLSCVMDNNCDILFNWLINSTPCTQSVNERTTAQPIGHAKGGTTPW